MSSDTQAVSGVKATPKRRRPWIEGQEIVLIGVTAAPVSYTHLTLPTICSV